MIVKVNLPVTSRKNESEKTSFIMSTDFVNKCNTLYDGYNWHKNHKWLGINT